MIAKPHLETPASRHGERKNRAPLGLRLSVHFVRNAFIFLSVFIVLSISLLLIAINLVEATRAFLALPIAALAAFLATWGIAKPLSIALYVREVRKEQERYRRLYTPLSALMNTYETPITYYPTARGVNNLEQNVHDLLDEQEAHFMILGLPGAGKTIVLRVYQYIALQQLWELMRGNVRIPVFIPMRNYNAFLKKTHSLQGRGITIPSTDNGTLLDFLLYEGELSPVRHLRPYLKRLIEQGGTLFLCDGLNEIDSYHLEQVTRELVQITRGTKNRLVTTCREVDYREQPAFSKLVRESRGQVALIPPLQLEQMYGFIKRYVDTSYVDEQGDRWQYSAEQIMQVIQQSRLRYNCTNPLMLFTLMRTVNGTGLERGMQLDTRGRLLREFVSQLIRRELKKPKWEALTEKDVLFFLSEVACTGRRAKYRNAIQLGNLGSIDRGDVGSSLPLDEMVDILQAWLDDPDIQEIDSEVALVQLHDPYTRVELRLLVQFSEEAALLTISENGVLSFRHELIAEYFVAECLFEMQQRDPSALPFGRELLTDIALWSEPVAMWAGFLQDPMTLAKHLAELGQRNPNSRYNALALSLVCVGVVWTPPQARIQYVIVLPRSVEETLAVFTPHAETRVKLAAIFKRCAEEGGLEVYRSLLPLINLKGMSELLLLLDKQVVPGLLFEYLCDVVNTSASQDQIKQLVRVLGRFGAVVLPRARELSQPLRGRNVLLRSAAIDILGRTGDENTVESLVSYLSDADQHVVVSAVNALVRLGPALVLERVVKELGNHAGRGYWAALAVLKGFLDERVVKNQVNAKQHQRIVEALVPVLSSNYALEARQEVRAALQRQVNPGESKNDNRLKNVVGALTLHLSSEDEVLVLNVIQLLKQIDRYATSRLIVLLKQRLSEIVCVRIIEVLGAVRDPSALEPLLSLLADPSQVIQKEVATALQNYAPDSIPKLIDVVLSSHKSREAAIRAARILQDIGQQSVVPIIQALPRIVAGRTQLLVGVLEYLNDARAIPVFIALLKATQKDMSLAIPLTQALSSLGDKQVVTPMLEILAESTPPLYDEISKALSRLGKVALDGLLAALDVRQETATTPGIRHALLEMQPFPDEYLLTAFKRCSDAQARQIMTVFIVKGPLAANFLVSHLFYPHARVGTYVRRTLDRMEGRLIIPPLLEALNRPSWLPIISGYLLKQTEAIPRLVNLLGDPERSSACADILLGFGPQIILSMVHGLSDPRRLARERSQAILVALVRQNPETMPQVVGLFTLLWSPDTQNAREALLSILTNDLADLSIPALLEGLGDVHLKEGITEALVRLVHKQDARSDSILDSLLDALRIEERRVDAETVLEKIGVEAVEKVADLIIDSDQAVAQATQRILRNIGAPALPVIWAAYSDVRNPMRRDAAQNIFRELPTTAIQDRLVQLLTSDQRQDVEMALTLLLERINDESVQPPDSQRMISALLEYLQMHNRRPNSLRIMAFLLLLSKETVINHVIQALYEHPTSNYGDWLIPVFLLLGLEGEEAKVALLKMFYDSKTPRKVRAEEVSALAMMEAYPEVMKAATALSSYGLAAGKGEGIAQAEQMEISLRALGGLLASGKWNIAKLQELRRMSLNGSPEHELYSILLGWYNGPYVTKLGRDLRSERDIRKMQRHQG